MDAAFSRAELRRLARHNRETADSLEPESSKSAEAAEFTWEMSFSKSPRRCV
jgi:hypothetical protein